jgi:hypothetical protein
MRGLQIAPAGNAVATENDVGLPIMRRRFTGLTLAISGTLVLTKAQKKILFDFWADTLAQGTLEFVMPSWHDGSVQDHSFPPDSPPVFLETGTRYDCPITLRYTVTT